MNQIMQPLRCKKKDAEQSQHELHSAPASQAAPTDNTGWKCTVCRQMRTNCVDTNTGRPSLRTKHENVFKCHLRINHLHTALKIIEKCRLTMTAETYTAFICIKNLTSIMETIIFTTATEVGAIVLLDYRRNKLRRGKHFTHCYVGQTWIQTRQSRYTVYMDITMTSCKSVLNV